MALPLPATLQQPEAPPERPLRVAMRHTGPPAVMHDSYLGGFASGFRVVYTDAKHYVWWWTTSSGIT